MLNEKLMFGVREIDVFWRKALSVTKCILVFFALSACTSPDIYYNKNFNPPVYFGTHVVQSGETLYKIAWRYGRDYKELASANNIKSPYTVFVGQKIDLEVSASAIQSASNSASSSPSGSSNVTKRKRKPESRYKSTKNKNLNNSNNITWAWPHVGLILAKYSVNSRSRDINKGIDIGGAVGDDVNAAASGEVVYAGNGLLGYGNLIIINHSDRFLSAYGHNQTMLVKEGEPVRRGQRIATMGTKGQKPVLHFEIRKDGQPVNPEKYLPKR
ncbi:hypothetical protein A3715_19400 [Oleiphilus sp. HI0009]|nr:hypothetical protein A3715_19400 [Oleiphilus sp. HI0009]